MRIKVGITQRVDKIESYKESRDALDQRLIDWVQSAGCIPIPIPNNLVDTSLSNILQPNLQEWLQCLGINFILLTGGNDIGDVKERDLTEEYLLFWANKHNKSLLGICRGMQMMSTFDGAELRRIENHTNTRHKLKIIGSNQVFPEEVNSYHKKKKKKCPTKYEILAVSEDGSIEAIKHLNLNWEGWMWHPEREAPFNMMDIIRFKSMLENGK